MNAKKPHKEVTILLVEDDDVDAQGIMRSFKKRKIGNNIIRARDGVEALEMLNNGDVSHPNIILLDLQMPRMNGLEFLTKIRNDDKLKSSVVFILTTSKADSDIVASYEQFVAGYFVKDDVGSNFSDMIDMLEGYWKIAYLPD
ncbi:MAG: two-component system response regulator [Kangiella sp.]|nr:MAG: two-component system response regulator [Kangiella sp.]